MAEQFANLASTTLNGTITNVQTSITVTDASSFPSTGNFRIVIDTELMLVTSVAGNVFTVTRGVESTTQSSHTDTSLVCHVLTKASLVLAVQQNSIDNVVEDTTPQLGGDLDVNGNDIVSVSGGDIKVDTDGTGAIKLITNQLLFTTSDIVSSQAHKYIVRNTTTNATPTELFLDGSSVRVPVPSANKTWAFSILISARRTDAANESGAWKIEGAVDNQSGLAALVDNPMQTILALDSSWSVDAIISANTLAVEVTGEGGKTVAWTACVDVVESG